MPAGGQIFVGIIQHAQRGQRQVQRGGGVIVCAVLALELAACSVPRRLAHPELLPGGASDTVEGLAAAIQANSARIEHEPDGKVRSAKVLRLDLGR